AVATSRAWIGSIGGSSSKASGNVKLITGKGDESHFASLTDMFVTDLGTSASTGGNVVVGLTDASGFAFSGYPASYNSPHDWTFLTNGSIEYQTLLQNHGAGAVTVVAG